MSSVDKPRPYTGEGAAGTPYGVPTGYSDGNPGKRQPGEISTPSSGRPPATLSPRTPEELTTPRDRLPAAFQRRTVPRPGRPAHDEVTFPPAPGADYTGVRQDQGAKEEREATPRHPREKGGTAPVATADQPSKRETDKTAGTKKVVVTETPEEPAAEAGSGAGRDDDNGDKPPTGGGRPEGAGNEDHEGAGQPHDPGDGDEQPRIASVTPASERTASDKTITRREIPNKEVVAGVISEESINIIEASRAVLTVAQQIANKHPADISEGDGILDARQREVISQTIGIRNTLFYEPVVVTEAPESVEELVRGIQPALAGIVDTYLTSITSDLERVKAEKEQIKQEVDAVDIFEQEGNMAASLTTGRMPESDDEVDDGMPFLRATDKHLDSLIELMRVIPKGRDMDEYKLAVNAERRLWLLDAFVAGAQMDPQRLEFLFNFNAVKAAELRPIILPSKDALGGLDLGDLAWNEYVDAYNTESITRREHLPEREVRRRARVIAELVAQGMNDAGVQARNRDIHVQKRNFESMGEIADAHDRETDGFKSIVGTIANQVVSLASIPTDLMLAELEAAKTVINDQANRVRGSEDAVIDSYTPLEMAESYAAEGVQFLLAMKSGLLKLPSSKKDRDLLNKLNNQPIQKRLRQLLKAKEAREGRVLDPEFKIKANMTADILRGKVGDRDDTVKRMEKGFRDVDPEWQEYIAAERGILIALATNRFNTTTMEEIMIMQQVLAAFDQGDDQTQIYRREMTARYATLDTFKEAFHTRVEALTELFKHLEIQMKYPARSKPIIQSLLGGATEKDAMDNAARKLLVGEHADPTSALVVKLQTDIKNILNYLNTGELPQQETTANPDAVVEPGEAHVSLATRDTVDLSHISSELFEMLGEQTILEIEWFRQWYEKTDEFLAQELFTQRHTPPSGYEDMSPADRAKAATEEAHDGADMAIRPIMVPTKFRHADRDVHLIYQDRQNAGDMVVIGAKAQALKVQLGSVAAREVGLLEKIIQAADFMKGTIDSEVETLENKDRTITPPAAYLAEAATLLERLQEVAGWMPTQKTLDALKDVVTAEGKAFDLTLYKLGFEIADEDTKAKYLAVLRRVYSDIKTKGRAEPEDYGEMTRLMQDFRQIAENKARTAALEPDTAPEDRRTDFTIRTDLTLLTNTRGKITDIEDVLKGTHKILQYAVTELAIDQINPLVRRLLSVQERMQSVIPALEDTSTDAKMRLEGLAMIEAYLAEHAQYLLDSAGRMEIILDEEFRGILDELTPHPLQERFANWDTLQSQLAAKREPAEIPSEVTDKAKDVRNLLEGRFTGSEDRGNKKREVVNRINQFDKDGQIGPAGLWILAVLKTDPTASGTVIDRIKVLEDIMVSYAWQVPEITRLENGTAEQKKYFQAIKDFAGTGDFETNTQATKQALLNTLRRLMASPVGINTDAMINVLLGKEGSSEEKAALRKQLLEGLEKVKTYLETGRTEMVETEVYPGDQPTKEQDGQPAPVRQPGNAAPVTAAETLASEKPVTEELADEAPEPVRYVRQREEQDATGKESQLVTLSTADLELMEKLFAFGFRVSHHGVGNLRRAWREERLEFSPLQPDFQEIPPEEKDRLKTRLKNKYSEREALRSEPSPQRLMLERIDWLYEVAERYNGKIFQPNKSILGGAYLVCLIEYEDRKLAILETPLTHNATYMIPEELIEIALSTQQTWEEVAKPYRKTEALSRRLAIKTNHIPVEVPEGSAKTYDQLVMETHDLRVFDDIDTILAEIRGTDAPRPRYQPERAERTEQTTPREKLSLDPYLDIIDALSTYKVDPNDDRVEKYFGQGGTNFPNLNYVLFERFFARQTRNLPVAQVENFARLFREQRLVRLNPEEEFNHEYLDIADLMGKPWENFLDYAEELIDDMAPVLDIVEQYEALNAFRARLVRRNDQEQLALLDELIDHPLGMAAYRIALDDMLVPMLDRAYDYMQAARIDPTKFYNVGHRQRRRNTITIASL